MDKYRVATHNMLQNTISEHKFDLICHSKAEKQDNLYGQRYLYKLEVTVGSIAPMLILGKVG